MDNWKVCLLFPQTLGTVPPPPHLSSSITSLLCSSADLACQLLIQHLASAYLGFYPPSIEWKIMQIPLKWTVMDDTGKEIVQKSQ